MTQTAPPPVELPATEAHRFPSGSVGRDLEVRVGRPLPGLAGDPVPPFRILYLLDADLWFGTAVEASRIMHRLFGELPPLLVVGVAVGSDDFGVQGELRTRDFTFSRDAGVGRAAPSAPGAGDHVLPEGRRTGGADRFLAFLADELRPWVRERFEVSPVGSVLFGSSLGGLFVLHALLTRPAAFDGFAAVSPALWWDDEAIFDREEALAKETDDLPARVFLAAGQQEEDPRIPGLARFRLVTNVERMARRLRARGYPSLEVVEHVLAGESHTSAVPAALTRVLRTLYGEGSAATDLSTGGGRGGTGGA